MSIHATSFDARHGQMTPSIPPPPPPRRSAVPCIRGGGGIVYEYAGQRSLEGVAQLHHLITALCGQNQRTRRCSTVDPAMVS